MMHGRALNCIAVAVTLDAKWLRANASLRSQEAEKIQEQGFH